MFFLVVMQNEQTWKLFNEIQVNPIVQLGPQNLEQDRPLRSFLLIPKWD